MHLIALHTVHACMVNTRPELPPVLQSEPVVLMCTRKVPRRLADRWDCHSGLIPGMLTLVISEGEQDEQPDCV